MNLIIKLYENASFTKKDTSVYTFLDFDYFYIFMLSCD